MYISPVLPTRMHSAHSFILLYVVAFCLLPCPAQTAWFRVGVVGPWGCDPLFAKALPSVAAQLAVNRINKDPSLAYAVTFDYVVLQVRCPSCQCDHMSQIKYFNFVNKWLPGPKNS